MGCSSRVTIVDKTPIKTVCTAYGVNPRTAHDWKRKFEAGSLAKLLGPRPISAAALTGFMQEAGARYRSEYA
jgi:hypothetical protein